MSVRFKFDFRSTCTFIISTTPYPIAIFCIKYVVHISMLTYLEIIYSKTFANFKLEFAKYRYIYAHALTYIMTQQRTWLNSRLLYV